MEPIDQPPAVDLPETGAVIYVTFQAAGKLFPYKVPQEPIPPVGSLVIVNTERGPTVATVATGQRPPPRFWEEEILEITRIANREDLTVEDRNRERELKSTRICLNLIQRHGLPMKLVAVHCLLGGQKAIFYFTADGRIDFRLLVKDLARDLRVRVEMRQIGVRDETKMLGGVGHCGLELCCSTWLRDFVPVSIRMAKDQNLALNPQKVSGACGRLLCCLAYEHETYVEHRKELPKVGRKVNTTQGSGKVVALEVLKRRFVLETDDGTRLMVSPEELLNSASGPVFSQKSHLADAHDDTAGETEEDPAASDDADESPISQAQEPATIDED